MTDESYACGQVAKRLAILRRKAPSESEVRHGWQTANGKYIEHVTEGSGDPANGSAITAYYVERQAYAMYAKERGFTLEVR